MKTFTNRKAKASGFTLVELMIVVAVAAVILGLGLPSFLTMIENTKLRNVKGDMLDMIRVARLTAVEQKAYVTACGSTDGTSCSSSADDWSNIILLLQGQGDDATVLQRIRVNDRAKVIKSNTDTLAINFEPTGWVPDDQSSFYICPDDLENDKAYRLVLSMSGKVRSEPYKSGATWSCS